jgi:hypothetical protein
MESCKTEIKNKIAIKTVNILLLLLASGLISSCGKLAKVGYVTSTHNMPMLKERLEGNVMGSIGSNHVECQASVSPIKYVGLVGNWYSGFPLSLSRSSEYGLGGYYPFAKKFLVEVYALSINTDITRNKLQVHRFLSEYADATLEELYSRYKGYSVQCDFGFFPEPKDDLNGFSNSISIGAKYSDVDYSYFEYRRSEYQRWETSTQTGGLVEVVHLPQHHQRFLALSGTFRTGFEPVRFMFQYSHHFSLDGYPSSDDTPPYYKPFWISIGIELFITRHFRENFIPKRFDRKEKNKLSNDRIDEDI